MSSQTIVLATCAMWPEVSTSDTTLLDELARRGHRVTGRPWNDAPIADFTEADMVVLRSNWDFHHHLDEFDAWLTTVEESEVRLINDASLIRSHNHKAYLLQYAAAGLRTPKTLVADDLDPTTIGGWMDEHRLDQAVVKPAWGASGHGVDLIWRDELDAARTQWRATAGDREVLVQEFQAGIRDGEYALVFLGGSYSHALHRIPSRDDFRINSRYGGRMVLAEGLDPAAIAFGEQVIEAIPAPTAYARIDIVGSPDGFTLMEVELNEPAIGLDLADGSAAMFADALLNAGP